MLSRRSFRFACLAGLIALVVLTLRGDLPRWVAAALIVDDSAPALAPGETPVFLLPLGGENAEEVAAQWIADGQAAGIWVLHGPPNRVVQLGARPPTSELVIAELVEQGVERDRIELVQFDSGDQWAGVRAIAGRLKASPDTRLVVTSGEFSSRRLRHLIRHIAGPELSSRVHILPLADRRHDRTNWWQSRLGIRSVTASYFAWLAYFWFDERSGEDYLSVEEYEAESGERRAESGEQGAGNWPDESVVKMGFNDGRGARVLHHPFGRFGP